MNKSGCRYRRWLIWLAAGVSLSLALPASGQVQQRRYAYDAKGRLVRSVDPQGTVVTYTYDAVGNLLSIKRQTVNEIGPPGMTSLSPASGKQRDVVEVMMSGSGLLGARLVSDSPGITFRNVIATDTQIRATLLIAHDAPVGVATITAITPLGNALGPFTVLAAAPLITSVRASNGLASGGTRVTVRGLSITPDATVSVADVPASAVTVLDSTTITFRTPPGTPGSVAVLTSCSRARSWTRCSTIDLVA